MVATQRDERLPIGTPVAIGIRSDSAASGLSVASESSDAASPEGGRSPGGEHKAARLARWEQHGLVAVGITSAPETDGTDANHGAGADTVAEALRSSPQASLISPPAPDKEELNRRGWDLLKRAEGWMLDPPALKPGSTSEASLPGFDAEAHGMRVHLEVQKMAVLLVTDGAGRDAYAGSTLIAEVRLEPQAAAEDEQEREIPCPGLELVLRKSRLATLYDLSIGRLCITDERPKAKEKCPSPEGTVVRPDGKVLGKTLTLTLTRTRTRTRTLNPDPILNPTPNPNPGPRQADLGRLGRHRRPRKVLWRRTGARSSHRHKHDP